MREIGREVKELAEKHRYNLIMSMDDPVQKEAWELLCDTKPGTRNKMVCNAIVRHDFEDRLRQMIREELENVSFVAQKEPEEKPTAVNDEVLDFIFQLQNSAER